MSRYVGVDLHRRRSQVVVLDGDGVVVSSVNVDNTEQPYVLRFQRVVQLLFL